MSGSEVLPLSYIARVEKLMMIKENFTGNNQGRKADLDTHLGEFVRARLNVCEKQLHNIKDSLSEFGRHGEPTVEVRVARELKLLKRSPNCIAHKDGCSMAYLA